MTNIEKLMRFTAAYVSIGTVLLTPLLGVYALYQRATVWDAPVYVRLVKEPERVCSGGKRIGLPIPRLL